MTSTFSFGFAGDDIDIDIDETEVNEINETNNGQSLNAGAALPELIAARKHDMAEWVPSLPSQISFNKLKLAHDASQDENTGKPITLARREVFDIRTQLMAEDTPDEDNEELIAGLEKGDIKPNFYEGGFKTWECAVDLARLLVDTDDVSKPTQDRHIIELGAGTAVPSLALFAQLLSEPSSSTTQRKTHFTFADYNSAVLRLVTFPNLLLTWNYTISHKQASDSPEDGGPEAEEEELDITPELVQSFRDDIANRGITVDFISGAWSPAFVDLVFASDQKGRGSVLILASETIYSPASLLAFSETLLALLRRTAQEGVQSGALLAAKKVYFGVGGGVDEFLAVLGGVSGSEELKVEERLDIKSEGVGRVVLQIALKQ
ncbi:hypothetical protein BO94DRAFT_246064 [Aspergillus sclerotioniger CBS 115572]|uniref:protein-histidine N-methyltransferase n=1 Tax=Aspergillus sclerotioniger CBS 115572 TaxID=1450535 RepID=A0A317VH62_9EURO|nr:hypothetical protein BO94DRAFT_246064 [Aspergillus sclerotioniger CBS 115572]PWY72507.1 hypothetical protein BO94DRAFT_246064 [Aspergillus sclerotioniger CBS 115572]